MPRFVLQIMSLAPIPEFACFIAFIRRRSEFSVAFETFMPNSCASFKIAFSIRIVVLVFGIPLTYVLYTCMHRYLSVTYALRNDSFFL